MQGECGVESGEGALCSLLFVLSMMPVLTDRTACCVYVSIVILQVRATQVPPDMCNDPSSVTGEALVSLLDMSVQGKSLGIDPQSGEASSLMHLTYLIQSCPHTQSFQRLLGI